MGPLDHLKFRRGGFSQILSSHPKIAHLSRDKRWQHSVSSMGNVLKKPRAGARIVSAWLDTRRQDRAPDPFENEQKYPGVKIGARG